MSRRIVPDAASQRRFEREVAARLPGPRPQALALFVYASASGRLVDAYAGPTLRGHDLDGPQLAVLLNLWFAGPPYRRSPTVLSRMVVHSRSGMTYTLKRLVAAGLVERVEVVHDARARHVQLTDRGFTVTADCLAELATALDEAFAAVPTRRLRELTGAQREIAEVLAGLPDED